MATTFVEYTGDGNATKQFTFPSYQESDVKVRVDGVLKTTSTHYNITGYTTTGGGNVVFTSGNIPSSPANIRIYRDTNVDTAKATFTAGSSVKAADLNNNTTQLLYRAQEEQIPNLIHSYDIDDSAIETSKIKADAVTGAKIADDQINSEHYVDGSIDTAHLADDAVTASKIAAKTITNAYIADDTITSALMANDAIATAAIENNAVTTAKIADGSITSAKLASGTVATGDLADGLISTAKIAADAVTNAKIADDSIDSEHYVDGSIDTAHIGNLQVTTAKIAADAVDGTKIADDSINSEHYVDGSIDTAHIADSQITAAKIASNAVTTDKIADSELSTLAGMQSTTASNLASSTALTATTAELNQLDGITLETTLTGTSDTRIPTSKAVNDQILAVTNALGGFVAIADETSFPTSNPDPSNGAGTVVSISQVSSGSAVSINSSGVATIANGAGTGNTVTITGFPTTLRNTSLAANSGLQVQTTTTLHTYTFHKQLASAADIAAISATVNSFSNRYRVSSSAPTSSLDGGDLWYDTTNSKLMVYSSANSAWEEATAIGNFFISTISSSSNTGGGSATPNGTAYRFTISDAPTSAAQLIVSVDGVIQKPNSGSSQPSEGFVLVGNDIIFGAAPANGASIFVTVIGSTVGIGTPSNNTVTTAILQNGSVTTAKIVDANVTTAKIADDAITNAKLSTGCVSTNQIANGAILNADVNASAAIAGTKISPDFGSQNIATTGNVDANGVVRGNSSNSGKWVRMYGSAGTGRWDIYGHGANLRISDNDNAGSFVVDRNTDLNGGLDVTGNITVTGTVDGVDIAALNTTVGNISTEVVNDTSPQLGGDLASNGHDILLADTDLLKVGTGGDMLISHDGTNSTIDNQTGNLRIRNVGQFQVTKSSTENMIIAIPDGAVELYNNNQKKLNTRNAGIDITGDLRFDTSVTGGIVRLADNQKVFCGSGDDLQIYHTGSHSYLQHRTGNFYITAKADEDGIIIRPDGAVELYHNNQKKFETMSNGAELSGHLHLADGNQLRLGNVGSGGDLQIYHDGSSSNHIKGTGSHSTMFWTSGVERWYIDSNGHYLPAANGNYDIGSSNARVRNLYTSDLHLSNEAKGANDVDGTWGDWTIQEGESDLFLKNNRSGKKYKFNLTEVS